MSLPDKYVEYDVETRWNSTYRMLGNGLKARVQIDQFLALQTEIPPFAIDEWLRLSQINQVLAKFNELCFYLRRDQKPALLCNKVQETLDNLSSGPEAYTEAYEDAMGRIKGQDGDALDLAMGVLLWITCAERQLIA